MESPNAATTHTNTHHAAGQALTAKATALSCDRFHKCSMELLLLLQNAAIIDAMTSHLNDYHVLRPRDRSNMLWNMYYIHTCILRNSIIMIIHDDGFAAVADAAAQEMLDYYIINIM